MRSLTLLSLLIFGCQTSPEVKKTTVVVESGVFLSLQRTACMGACPVYVVEVSSDGTVRFKGERHVKVTEPVELKLGAEELAKLSGLVEQSDFAKWKNYMAITTSDMPTVVLTFRGKSVQHSRGDEKAPEALTKLEDDLDAVIGTDRWVKGAGAEAQ